MDKDEKTKMLLDMQEHPEQFSEQALEQMLNDSEAQEFMEATALLKRAMSDETFTMSEEEIESEWQDFASKHFVHQKPQQSWLKMAATFIGILFVTGIAFAAIQILSFSPTSDGEGSGHKLAADTIVEALPHSTGKEPGVETSVVFDNVTLDSIARSIAAYHQIAMESQNEQARYLRFYFVWKQDDSLQEVVGKLNMFEHVNMAVENGKLIVR